MAIERTDSYEPDSVGGRLQRIADDLDAAAPGFGLGDALLADWNLWWVPTQEKAIAQASEVMDGTLHA